MIVQGIMELVMVLLTNVLSFISIPAFPQQFTSAIDMVLNDFLFQNLGLIGFFVRWNTILVAVPLVIVIVNLDKMYALVIWILRKIPILGMN